MTIQVAVRLETDQVARVDRLVRALRSTRSDVIRRALELYLYRLECEHDARVYERKPFTDAELALADDEQAWKGTPEWRGARSGGPQFRAGIGRSSFSRATR
jgi:predicted transcriptional regulator